MKQNLFRLVLAPLAIAALVWGCRESKQETSAPIEPPANAGKPEPPAETAKGAALGTEKGNEHFMVTLTVSPAEPKVGKAKFTARVTHHGQSTTGANVRLSLSMPSMNMGGPEVVLKHTKDGVYEGEADLSMGGDWRAKVSVDQEGHTGEAVYDFVVMQ